MCKQSSSSEPKQPQWCKIICIICFITCFTATTEVFVFVFVLIFLNSPFKCKYLGSNKSQNEAFFLGFLYVGGDCYTYREYSMKVSQRITISNFQTFHFQRPFLHQNFSLSCITRELIYILGRIVVAHVLNVHESQLLSMFCAQFQLFCHTTVTTCTDRNFYQHIL